MKTLLFAIWFLSATASAQQPVAFETIGKVDSVTEDRSGVKVWLEKDCGKNNCCISRYGDCPNFSFTYKRPNAKWCPPKPGDLIAVKGHLIYLPPEELPWGGWRTWDANVGFEADTILTGKGK